MTSPVSAGRSFRGGSLRRYEIPAIPAARETGADHAHFGIGGCHRCRSSSGRSVPGRSNRGRCREPGGIRCRAGLGQLNGLLPHQLRGDRLHRTRPDCQSGCPRPRLPVPAAISNPYVRVDALRSHRHVRASLGGVTLAETTTPVLVFETGLPIRYYFDRTDVAFEHLVSTGTQTACPYKGVTSGYWSVRTGDQVRDGHQDLAWAYDYPTRQLLPITGLIAFYNEKIDLDVDGLRLPQARTHFFK